MKWNERMNQKWENLFIPDKYQTVFALLQDANIAHIDNDLSTKYYDFNDFFFQKKRIN